MFTEVGTAQYWEEYFNYVEGYNHKINDYIAFTHPHIYSAINNLKVLETSTGLNYYQHESGKKSLDNQL